MSLYVRYSPIVLGGSGPITAGDLTDAGTDGIVVTGGTGAVIGAGTQLAQHVADTSHNGYLSSVDWNTFNGKQSPLTFGNFTDAGTDGITVTNGTGAVIGSGTSIAQHVADTTHNGYLSSTDWNTFNNKQAALTIGNLTDAGTDGITVTGGTGAIIGSGTSLAQHVSDTTHNGYLSSTDWNTFNGKMDVLGPTRNVYVGQGAYTTVQLAVTYAETLAGSAEDDNQGVTVHVPAGYYNEAVLIRRNVNIKGSGASVYTDPTIGNTRITSITVRPTTSTVAPGHVCLSDLTVDVLVADNQTTAVSGIYNVVNVLAGGGLDCNNCSIGYYTLRDVFTNSFKNCNILGSGGSSTSYNTDTVWMAFTSVKGTVTHTMDSSDPHAATYGEGIGLSGSWHAYNSFVFAALTATTVVPDDSFTYGAIIDGSQTFFVTLTMNDGTYLDVAGGTFFSAPTLNAGSTVNYYNNYSPYTPATPGNWSSVPVYVQTALDTLASSKATNPMTTLGDIIYGGTSGTPTRLAGDTSNADKFLRSLSSSGVAAAPTWSILSAADITAGTLAVARGGTGVTSVTTSPTASSFAGWDANSNLSAVNVIEGYATTATAGATTTLVVGDKFQQYFTGSTTQTVKLPVTNTLALGQQYQITNLSSGVVTVQSSGANTLQAMAANTQLTATVISTSGTGTASWNWSYSAVQGALSGGGTVTSVAASGPSGIATWSSAVTTSGTLTQTLSNQNAGTFLAGPTSGSAAAPTFRSLQLPTIQKFTTAGSGTYTTPLGTLYFRVRMVGGGGGGGAGGTDAGLNGTDGNASIFGASTANGGSKGQGGSGGSGLGGPGGTATVGAGATGTALQGGNGSAGGSNTSAVVYAIGGPGGNSFFGGGGSGAWANAGSSGAPNTGGGGGGGSSNTSASAIYGGSGGGAGGYIDVLIAPSASGATYNYTVAATAAGHVAGTSGNAGGAGAAGYIEVTEYYQ